MRVSGNSGVGVLAVLFVILGIAATGGMIAISTKFLLDERAISATNTRMRQIGFAISRTSINLRVDGQRQYETDVGALPSQLTDLATKPAAVSACALDGANQRVTGWCGPYIVAPYPAESPFTDGWHRALVYSSAGRTLRSYGPNQADDGGAGDDLVQTF